MTMHIVDPIDPVALWPLEEPLAAVFVAGRTLRECQEELAPAGEVVLVGNAWVTSGDWELLLGTDDDLSDGARFQVAPSSIPLLDVREACLSARGSAQPVDRHGDDVGDALPFDEERCFAAPGSISIRDIALH